MSTTILAIGLLVFLAHLFTALFERTRIPDVLLLMILGLILGPLLGIVTVQDFGKVGAVVSTIALIVILFEGGTTLNIETIRKSAGPTLAITLLTFVITALLAATFLVLVFGSSWLAGLVLGSIIGGTSSAVVVPMVRGLKLKEPSATILMLESSLTDVLCIVLTYSFLEASTRADTGAGRILGNIISSLVFAGAIGIIGGHAWLFVLDKVRRFPNTILTTFAFIFVLFGLTEMLGFSGAISSLAFGITLTNFESLHFNKLPLLRSVQWQSVSQTEHLFFREIVFLLKVVFFVYLGISIRLDSGMFFLLGLLLVLLVYGARMLIVRFVLPRTIRISDAAIVAVMIPKGLAAAVLAMIPAQYFLPEAAVIQDVVYMVVLISILLTSALVPLIGTTTLHARLFRPFAADGTVAAAPESTGK